MKGFYQNTYALLESIEDCLKQKRILPCLALVYTGIDVVASLERKPNERPKAAFLRWVDRYLLTTRPLNCTALELYAARCGVLHSFTADSELAEKLQVRKVLYAWGTARVEHLEAASAILGRPEHASVHVRDLIDAFRHGCADWFAEIGNDPERLLQVERRAGAWFVHLEEGAVEEFVAGRSDASST